MRLPDLSKYKKIAIVGRPRVGKTTLGLQLSGQYKLPLVHADDFIGLTTFEHQPDLIVADLMDRDTYIIEGVQVARCFKRGLKPEIVIWLEAAIPLDSRHKSLATIVDRSMQEYTGEVVRVRREDDRQ